MRGYSAVCISVIGVCGILYFEDARSYPLEMVAILFLWGILLLLPRPVFDIKILLGIAFVLRIGFVFQEPSFSDDLYRYLWEGRLAEMGGNPYVEAPSDFRIVDGIREYVNHPEIPAVYPPVAQLLFRLIGLIHYSPMMWQFFVLLCDLGIILGLSRIVRTEDRDLLTLYALHPLSIIESSSSAHIDFVAALCLVWSVVVVRTGFRAGWWLFCGGWIKLFPWIFLPLLRNWKKGKLGAMILISCGLIVPFWDVEMLFALGNYTRHWEFNSSIFALFHWAIPEYSRWLCFLCGLLLYGWVWKQKWPIARSMLWLGGGFVLLSPTVHPWYGIWVWIPAIMIGNRSWNIFASLLPLSYIALETLDPNTGVWSPPLWPSLLIYTALLISLSLDIVRQKGLKMSSVIGS